MLSEVNCYHLMLQVLTRYNIHCVSQSFLFQALVTCIVVHYTVKIGQEEKYHEIQTKKISQSDIGGVQVDSHSSSTVSLMQSFGQRNKEDLATHHKYWRPPCNVTNTHALSAINRAKTEKCRREISSISCLTGDNVLHPDFIQK